MPRSVSDAHLGESVLLRLAVGDLDQAERQGAERHLLACDTCREAFRASERLDGALRSAGPALFDGGSETMTLPAADPFARRPEARRFSMTAKSETVSLAEEAVHAVPEAREMATRLGAAFEDDGAREAALAALDLDAIRDRLALAYALDGRFERVEQDATLSGRLAAAALDRISKEAPRSAGGVAERTVPLADLRGKALLLSGAANLFGGGFAEVEVRLQTAWRAFGKGQASEPLLARTETLEALRRVVEGRWKEAEALAARAGETFAFTGAEADAARATLASGLAAWGEGRNRAALTLLRKAALGFQRAEAWGGFSIAACAAALCLAADGQVAESRRAFCDLRRRKARRAPLAERLFVRETERIALLLVREPGKKKEATFRFSPSDILLLRAASFLADGIVSAAREGGEKLEVSLRALDEHPARAFAFLYTCQKAALLVVQDPLRALEVSRRIFYEAQFLEEIGAAGRELRAALGQVTQAEGKLLESTALNMLGYPLEARVAAARACELFGRGDDAGFGRALANYFEGSAALFAKEFAAGERLLKKAIRVFSAYDQTNLRARAEGTLGTLYLYRGDGRRALPFLERAIDLFDSIEDERFLAAVLTNRGAALSRLGRLDEARTCYTRALMVSRRTQSQAQIAIIRSGLALIDINRGEYARALQAFRELSSEERREGRMQLAFVSDLYTAECLGRLGRNDEMAEVIRNVRAERRGHFVVSPLALAELFACLDQGELNANFIAHVRSYLEDEANGIQREYRRFKVAG